jgi:hypothetical protein
VRLRDELEETVDLAVLDGAELRFVEQLPGPQLLRALSAVGVRFSRRSPCRLRGHASRVASSALREWFAA